MSPSVVGLTLLYHKLFQPSMGHTGSHWYIPLTHYYGHLYLAWLLTLLNTHGFDSWCTPRAPNSSLGTQEVETNVASWCLVDYYYCLLLLRHDFFYTTVSGDTPKPEPHRLCLLLVAYVYSWCCALLLLLVGMPADFVLTWFRLVVYPMRLQVGLGYTQNRNHSCTTLLLLPTLLNSSGCHSWCAPSTCN